MSVSWDDVAALSPSLAAVSAEAQALIIAMVDRQVGEAQWGDLFPDGQILLAAHLGALTLNTAGGSSQAVGPVVSQTVGPVSRSFAVLTTSGAAGSFDSTTWGQEYARLRRMLPVRVGTVLEWRRVSRRL